MANKFVITKPFNRNNAKATSDYLHNTTDPDHINTLILDELNWKSEAFNKIGADWKILDDYEDVMKCKRHAKEFILPLPMETMAKDGSIYSKEHFERAVDVFISNLSKEIGIEKDNLIWEAQAHLNIETSEKPENPHIHFIVYEREITFERSFETYDRNYWHDGKRPFNNKELDNQFLMADDKEAFLNSLKAEKNIVLSHKKGDVKLDKDGKPKEKAFEYTFSNKNREINRWQTLENLRMTFQKEFSLWTPQHDYHIGRLPERVQEISYKKSMEKSHPEKAEAIKNVNSSIREINKELSKDEPERRRTIANKLNNKIKSVNQEAYHQRENKAIQIFNNLNIFLLDEFRSLKNRLKELNKKIYDFVFDNGVSKTLERLDNKDDGTIVRYSLTQVRDWDFDDIKAEKYKFDFENGIIRKSVIDGDFENREEAKKYLELQEYIGCYTPLNDDKLKSDFDKKIADDFKRDLEPKLERSRGLRF